MHIIAVYSLKGGVGKTTTAINLAYLCAKEGARTLIWDLDLQASTSLILSSSASDKKSIKVLTDKKTNLDKRIKSSKFENLDILPADFSLRKMDEYIYSKNGAKFSFKHITKSLQKKYDYIIIDCASGFNALTEHVLHIADVVLTPVIPSPLSFEMLDRLKKQLKKQRSDDNVLLFPFFSMVDRRKNLHREVLHLDHNGKRGFLHATIPYSKKTEQMVVHHAPLPHFDTRTNATKGYKSLWKEIKENIKMHARVKKIKMWR